MVEFDCGADADPMRFPAAVVLATKGFSHSAIGRQGGPAVRPVNLLT